MRTQQPTFAQSVPIDVLMTTANSLSLECLENTVQLLRKPYPTLALSLQNSLATLRTNNDLVDSQFALLVDFNAQHVANVIAALTQVAESSVSNSKRHKTSIAMTHQILLSWLIYGQKLIEQHR